MNKLLPIYKPIGKTPLQMIQEVKKNHPKYKDEPISYAGRLDPMAHGVLLLMIGEANKNRQSYLHMPKTYEFDAVLGIETDSYDILGLLKKTYSCHSRPACPPVSHDRESISNNNFICEDVINTFISQYTGKFEQSYPPFSSKPVNGKPLFWWAKQQKLDEITIPAHEVEVYSFLYKQMRQITKEALHTQIVSMITQVEGDFRQQEIQQQWSEYFNTTQKKEYTILSFVIECSSGTYIRGLVHALGIALGTGAVALDIHRTKVGEYTI